MASHALMLKFASSKWTCAVLMVAAALAVGSRAYLSYLAPGDILQNSISAREFALGHSLYPSKLNELVLADLHDHPPAEPLSNHVARLKNLQRDQFAVSGLNIVDAHPPLFSLLLVPVVQVVGVYFPAILVNAVALVLYGYVVHQLATTLFPHLNHRWQLLLFALSLGWQPVLASVRHASQSLIIGSLVVLCWMLIRRHRDILGGAALGVATVLKVYPAVLLAYLIFRRRGAFAAAAAVIALLGAAVWMCVGVSDLYRLPQPLELSPRLLEKSETTCRFFRWSLALPVSLRRPQWPLPFLYSQVSSLASASRSSRKPANRWIRLKRMIWNLLL